MRIKRKPSFEILKRFQLIPTEYGTPAVFFHCNTPKTWQNFIKAHFTKRLSEKELKFQKTISNASFRLAGLEMKIGLLLADDEAKVIGSKTLSDAIRPSIVIDSVLSTFSILEGLTILSYLSSLSAEYRIGQIARKKRGNKISKGLKVSMGKSFSSEVNRLRTLRDRCIHQDSADLKDGRDYEHVFRTDELRPHIELLHSYLKSLETEKPRLPETNLKEFWSLDFTGHS
ncbi:MAG: hypothetical protein AAGF53_15420 [Pseudomonadota bacterium]